MSTIFLMISRILYDKGYGQFVEASRIIRRDYANVRFQLLGDMDLNNPNFVPKEVIDADIKDNLIEYLGYQSNVQPIINEADCIVLPSFYNEGLSRVLMEAMALRKPIITTDIPGCRETVEDGKNGFLCQPNDTDSLIDSMKSFLSLSEESRKSMGLAGRERAEKIFNIENVIEVYHKITEKTEV